MLFLTERDRNDRRSNIIGVLLLTMLGVTVAWGASCKIANNAETRASPYTIYLGEYGYQKINTLSYEIDGLFVNAIKLDGRSVRIPASNIHHIQDRIEEVK